MSWSEMPLGEVIRLKRGHDLPASQRVSGDIPIISSSGITGYHNEAKANGPGVVTGRYGTLGEVHYVEGPYWPLNTALYVEDFKGNYPKYVGYLLTTLELGAKNEAGAVPGVNRNTLHQMSVCVPDVDTQVSIATVLSQYDDLIETNRRRIALLEEAARLLYREWFVNLRFPGHAHSKMVDGLPAKWHRVRLIEICEQEREQVNPASVAPGTHYLSMEHMTSKSICLGVWETAEKVSSSKVRFQRGDILFGRIRPYFHKVGVAQVDGITSTDMIVVRAKSKNLQPIVALAMSSDEFVGYAVTTSNGTKMPRADWKVLKNWEVVLPKEDVLADFAERLLPIFETLDVLSGQNIVLEKARDELLPKLMSGEIQP